MFAALGPLGIWVETGSKKFHCYIRWEPTLPATILWHGRTVGQLQRGPHQQVVLPPSIHPTTGRAYRWVVDPQSPLPTLSESWRAHLLATPTIITFPRRDAWDGPLPNDLLQRALRQPGARMRRHGVKFQCPGCRAEGHDDHHDNAIVYLNGRFGCAITVAHRRAVAVALGVIAPEIPEGRMPGPSLTVTATDLDRDWTGTF